MRETWVQSLGWEDPLEKEKATHSSIFAWRIPWTEEPGGLLSMGSHRVGHDWATKHKHNEGNQREKAEKKVSTLGKLKRNRSWMAAGTGPRHGVRWAVRMQSTVLVLSQSRPSLCNPTGCSPPGSSVRGVLQARTLPFPPPGPQSIEAALQLW